jgi:hypothetical protein
MWIDQELCFLAIFEEQSRQKSSQTLETTKIDPELEATEGNIVVDVEEEVDEKAALADNEANDSEEEGAEDQLDDVAMKKEESVAPGGVNTS